MAHNASLSRCRGPWGCRGRSRSSPALPFSGSCPRSVPRAPKGSPLVGALATLGTSVVANAPFLSAGAVACGLRLHVFPHRPFGLKFAPCIRIPNARPIQSYWRGLMPPAPPSPTRRVDYLVPSRGRCPRKPLPAERARGRGVFHGIVRLRASRPKWAICPLGLRPRVLKNHKSS